MSIVGVMFMRVVVVGVIVVGVPFMRIVARSFRRIAAGKGGRCIVLRRSERLFGRRVVAAILAGVIRLLVVSVRVMTVLVMMSVCILGVMVVVRVVVRMIRRVIADLRGIGQLLRVVLGACTFNDLALHALAAAATP